MKKIILKTAQYRQQIIFILVSLVSTCLIYLLLSRYSRGLKWNILSSNGSDYVLYSFTKCLLFIVAIAVIVHLFFKGMRAKRSDYSYIAFVISILASFPIVTYFLPKILKWQIFPDFIQKIFNLHIFPDKAFGMLCNYFLMIDVALYAFYTLLPHLMPKTTNPLFPAESVGKDDDKFSYSNSAKNLACAIKDQRRPVSVYGLYGEMGWGKSSYARMIVEHLMDEEILGDDELLYTYISLTESNEAKDFSRLFAEQWDTALSARYPRICLPSIMTSMKPILRDEDGKWLTSLISTGSCANIGLFPIQPWKYDGLNGISSISPAIADLFGHIPKIHEKVWIIVIDEIERSPIDEIFRLVEILERFKLHGSQGVPVKIVFLICISRGELKKYLELDKQSHRANLLLNFFFNDPKNITHTIFLPPIDYQLKIDMVKDEVRCLLDEVKYKHSWSWDKFKPSDSNDPSREKFIEDDKKSLEWVSGLITWKSPRLVKRIFSQMDLFYRSYRNGRMEMKPEAIRPSDVMCLSYMSIQYPQLIEFFKETVDLIMPSKDITKKVLNYLKNDYDSIFKMIEDHVGWEVSKENETEILQLFNICARSWLDVIEKKSIEKNADTYHSSTSWPRTMKSYLKSVEDLDSDEYKWVLGMFSRHKKEDKLLIDDEQSIDKVLDYTDLVRRFQSVQLKQLIDNLKLLYRWLAQGKVTIDPCNVGDTYYDDFIYQFCFYTRDIIRNEPNDKKMLDQIWSMIDEILKAAHIPFSSKFMLMKYFSHPDNDGGETDYTIMGAFKHLMMDPDRYRQIMSRLQQVYEDRDRDYYEGNKILYANEENFFYVLYQGWSGEPNNQEELHKIRSVAKRGLKDYPIAIKLYWQQWPNPDNKREMKIDMKNGTELYLPLTDLIEITKKSSINDEVILSKMEKWEEAYCKTIPEKQFQERFPFPDIHTIYYAFLKGLEEQKKNEILSEKTNK